ncbi:hypothetical protein LJC47_01840 [Desulfosarcina sp. OttesenSCG-928-B08]|nr:hypothetical protein [Desulfosarcina sp. OttesenSCG-928-B08]
MKKVIGVIVVLVIVIGAIALFMPSQKQDETTGTPETAKAAKVVTEAAQYLPTDTGLVLTLNNVSAMTTAFSQSRLFSTETVLAVMQEAQVSPEMQQQYAESVKDVTDFFASPSFKLLFGNTLTVAVLPLDLDAIAIANDPGMPDFEFNPDADKTDDPAATAPPAAAPGPADGDVQAPAAVSTEANTPAEILGRYVVAIATTRSPATLQAFTALTPDLNITQEEFDGLTLLKIVPPAEEITFYGYIDGNNVLLSPAKEGIRTCLNSKKTGANLNTNPWLAQAERYWATYPVEQTGFRAYMNIQSFVRSLSEAKHPDLVEAFAEADVKQLLDLYQGVEYLCGLIYTTDQSIDSASMVSVDPDKLHPVMKTALLNTGGRKNTSLHLLDRQPVLYVWGTPLNLEYMFDTYRKDPQVAKMFESATQDITGLTLDELAATLGPQYGFTLDTIVDTGLFPIPKLSLWVEVRNAANVEKAIDHIKQMTTAKGNAPSEEEVAGSTMNHWMLMPGDAGQPAVALHKDTLYLTSSVSLMKAILNNTADPGKVPTAAREKLGPEWSKKIDTANASVCVAYPSQFTGPLVNLIDFANNSQGGSLPVRTVKKEAEIFLNAMDYVAAYCNAEDKRFACESTLKWAPQSKAVSP